MSDRFYSVLRRLGAPAFLTSGRATVLGAEHTDRPGAYLLASNHESPYDVPLLMLHCRRAVDFVSITEVFERPFTRWLYGSMNAFPLDRSRPDAPTVRVLLDRLRRGRVVGLFPEGRMQRGGRSVLRTGRIRPGLGRLARLAGVPIVPAAVVGSPEYGRIRAWLPLGRTRYGVAFGPPIEPGDDPAETEARFVAALRDLHADLAARLPGDASGVPPRSSGPRSA